MLIEPLGQLKKQFKGLSKEELETCGELVLMPSERIQAILDRSTTDAAKKPGGCGTSSFNKNIKFDSEGQFNDGYYEQTDEDEGLDVISEVLDTLKNLARDMNEELDRQVPLIDEIDTKVDKASRQLVISKTIMSNSRKTLTRPILRVKVVGRSRKEASTSSLSPPPTVDDTSMEYDCMGGEEWDNSEDYEEEEYGGGNRFNVMTTNIAESLNSILLDEREYPVATIFNSIAHRFGEIFRKRYAEVNNSRTPFIPVAKNILRKNMTEGDKFYVNNINRSTDEFTVLGCGPSAKVNLSRRYVLKGSLTW
ncbi:hypothetical protein CQW23_21262 [Capsicum baccatum]|uniref:t-SNARE coiled-coil homology domain-containing protein n=1 Tax=Capsicum baccatum TaxID=33114 RepID=A0A2G2VXK1_CAPBA|nr:hypothetical protein CQW23_21262 [Capsicum baccatum]